MAFKDPEARRGYDKAWRAANPEKVRAHNKAWYGANPEYFNNYQKARRARDPGYAMSRRLRNRLNNVINRAQTTKSDATMNLVGCTQAELIRHLESTFTDGQSWDNRHLWHIDHRVPCAAFDLTDPIQQQACFSFKNLQVLWDFENRAKGAKIPLDIVSNS